MASVLNADGSYINPMYEEDRFFLVEGRQVWWVYHNTHSVRGDEFVSVHIRKDALDEACQSCDYDPWNIIADRSLSEVFSVYDEYNYEYLRGLFELTPYATGLGMDTLLKLSRALHDDVLWGDV